MKVTLDIGRKGGFTIWESGFWTPEKSGGWSLVVADPMGEPMPVIFSKNVTSNPDHFLFYANPGMVAVSVLIQKLPGMEKQIYQMSLFRFTSLQSSKSPNPKHKVDYKKETLWVIKSVYHTAFRHQELVDAIEGEFTIHSSEHYSANFKALLLAGAEKATTIQKEQRLFYGIPSFRETPPAANSPQPLLIEEDDAIPEGITHETSQFPSTRR